MDRKPPVDAGRTAISRAAFPSPPGPGLPAVTALLAALCLLPPGPAAAQEAADSTARAPGDTVPAGPPARGAAPEPADSAELRAYVDSLAVSVLDGGPAAGMSVAVVRGPDTLVWEGYGEADLELDVPARPETVYRIASITKQFTAAAVLRQAEAGRLSLDDPVRGFLPELPFPEAGITVRHLLTHTSGIPDYPDVEGLLSSFPRDPGHETLLGALGDTPLAFPPGTDWKYSNTGYYLLGMVLEEVTGTPYDQYVRDSLAAPLGLDRTLYCWNQPLVEDRAEGYATDEGGLVNEEPLEMALPFAAGGLCSTVGDLVAWSRALYGGEVVGEASLELMTSPVTLPDSVGTEYGFGVRVDSMAGYRKLYHSGGINGFASHLSHYPEDGLTVAVLVNTRNANASGAEERIARRAMGLPQPELLAKGISEAEARRYTGKYVVTGLQLPVEIVLADGELVARPAGQTPFRLVYRGRHEFRAEANPQLRLVFEMEEGRAAGFTLYHEGREFPAERAEAERR